MAKKKINIDFTKVPKPARIAISVVPGVILLVLIAFLVIVPKTKEIDKLKRDIAEQEKEIAKTQSIAGKLDDLKAENAKLLALLKELEENLPEEKEISSLLKQVSDLGLEAGLDILSWKPAPKKNHPSGIVYEVPVSISLTGSYHRIGHFFGSLTRLERIINIYNISLGGALMKNDELVLSASFSAATFTAVAEGGLSK